MNKKDKEILIDEISDAIDHLSDRLNDVRQNEIVFMVKEYLEENNSEIINKVTNKDIKKITLEILQW